MKGEPEATASGNTRMSDQNSNTLVKNANGAYDIFKILMGVFASIVGPAVLYVASAIVQFQVENAETRRDIASIMLSIEEIKSDARSRQADRYSAGQALSDWRLQESKDATQNKSIDRALEWAGNLSARLADVESAIRKE